MTDPDQAGEESAARQRPGMPRWVLGFIVAAVLLVAMIALLLALGHGPGQHMTSHTYMPVLAVSPVARS